MPNKTKHMTIDETIQQLKCDVDLILFDPTTGGNINPDCMNDLNKASYIGYINAINYLEEFNEMVSDYSQMKEERDKSVKYMQKSIDLSEVDGDTTGIYEGFVHIVHGFEGDTFATAFIVLAEDKRFVTLNECLNILKESGIEEPMTIVVAFESATHGEIYKYNEYRDKKWRVAGYTRGYA